MKKTLILACATLLFACSNNKATITGNLDGVPDGAKVTLILGGTHSQQDPIGEAIVTNGKFKFEAPLEEPRVFHLRTNSTGLIRLMASPGDKVMIAGTFTEPIVTGSEIHKEYAEKFVKPRTALNQRKAEIDNMEINKRLAEAHRNNDGKTVAEIRASEEWKVYEQADLEFFNHLIKTVEETVTANANTFWGPLLLMEHTSWLSPDMEKYYKLFSDEAKNSFYGKAMAMSLYGVPIGSDAPDFTAKDAAENEHSLKELLAGDKYILIDFWATWCGPCVRFMPTLKELAEKYADKMMVVAISTDKDHDAWQKFLEREQKPWLNLIDKTNISKAYGVSGIPSLFLIDPQAKLVFGKQSGQSVVDKLADVFGM
jgi:thiol-disulfide isomerase/thioredoxin